MATVGETQNGGHSNNRMHGLLFTHVWHSTPSASEHGRQGGPRLRPRPRPRLPPLSAGPRDRADTPRSSSLRGPAPAAARPAPRPVVAAPGNPQRTTASKPRWWQITHGKRAASHRSRPIPLAAHRVQVVRERGRCNVNRERMDARARTDGQEEEGQEGEVGN